MYIDALLDEANRVVGSARYALDGLKFKVYVRQPSDLNAIETALAGRLRPATSIVSGGCLPRGFAGRDRSHGRIDRMLVLYKQ
jgi:hypothetical protein